MGQHGNFLPAGGDFPATGTPGSRLLTQGSTGGLNPRKILVLMAQGCYRLAVVPVTAVGACVDGTALFSTGGFLNFVGIAALMVQGKIHPVGGIPVQTDIGHDPGIVNTGRQEILLCPAIGIGTAILLALLDNGVHQEAILVCQLQDMVLRCGAHGKDRLSFTGGSKLILGHLVDHRTGFFILDQDAVGLRGRICPAAVGPVRYFLGNLVFLPGNRFLRQGLFRNRFFRQRYLRLRLFGDGFLRHGLLGDRFLGGCLFRSRILRERFLGNSFLGNSFLGNSFLGNGFLCHGFHHGFGGGLFRNFFRQGRHRQQGQDQAECQYAADDSFHSVSFFLRKVPHCKPLARNYRWVNFPSYILVKFFTKINSKNLYFATLYT